MFGRRPARRAGRPGLVGTAARTAVVAGTAAAVTGRVARHQAHKAAAHEAAVPEAAPPVEAMAGPAPKPAAQPAAAGLTEADISSLERLARLHEQGVLSDEELTAAKARILGI